MAEPDFPVLPSELVAIIAFELHESHDGNATYEHAWRAVRVLTGVNRAWREGVEEHLLAHISFVRNLAFLKPDQPLLFPSGVRSVNYCMRVASELLQTLPLEPVISLLLRYVPGHPEAASLRECVAVITC